MKTNRKAILAAGVVATVAGLAWANRAMKGAPASEANPMHGRLVTTFGRTDETEHYYELRIRVYDGTDPETARVHLQSLLNKQVRLTITPMED